MERLQTPTPQNTPPAERQKQRFELNQEQLRRLDELSSYWRNVGISTAPTDRAQAEIGLTIAYRAAGLKPPEFVIWLRSPRAGATAARLLKSDLDWPHQLLPPQRAVWDDVWRQSIKQIEAAIGVEQWHQIRRQLRKEAEIKINEKYGCFVEKRVKEVFSEKMGIWIWKYLRKIYGGSVFKEVRLNVEEQVKAVVNKNTDSEVFSLTENADLVESAGPEKGKQQNRVANGHEEIYQRAVVPVTQQVWRSVAEPLRMMMNVDNGQLIGRQTWECGFGQHDAGWISNYDYLRFIGIKGTEPLEGIVTLTKSCGWWWPYKNLCILTDRPASLNRDNRGRLHNDSGMSIRYADDWGFYAWNGVLVDEYAIMEPEITLEMIEGETNIEVRRVLIERFGLDEYLKAGKVIKIHQDKYGILWRMNLNQDEPITVVQVINSTPEPDGIYKEYFLRVPPSMIRARQAIAWTFGLNEEDYLPLVET